MIQKTWRRKVQEHKAQKEMRASIDWQIEGMATLATRENSVEYPDPDHDLDFGYIHALHIQQPGELGKDGQVIRPWSNHLRLLATRANLQTGDVKPYGARGHFPPNMGTAHFRVERGANGIDIYGMDSKGTVMFNRLATANESQWRDKLYGLANPLMHKISERTGLVIVNPDELRPIVYERMGVLDATYATRNVR